MKKWLGWNERYIDVCGTSCVGWEWYISSIAKLGLVIFVVVELTKLFVGK